ncbi:MAG: leucine-rich repeat protein [Oscillospiraceae bacterium]
MDIPASIEGYPVTVIGSYTFNSCSSLTSVNIPSSVKTVGDYAFQYCTLLTSVNIPSSVTSIGFRAFYNCSSLASVNIPSSANVGNEAFYNCIELTTVRTTSSSASTQSVTIGSSAFSGCKSLTTLEISPLATKIGSYAFNSCSSLTSVTIPSSVKTIGNYAFQYCTSLTSVNIPSSVTSIDYRAFYKCSSLTSVNIPSSVTSIGGDAFNSCTSLKSVSIPASANIGNEAFYNCIELTTVRTTSSSASTQSVTIGSSAFSGCKSLTTLEISPLATKIGSYAFNSCSSLTSVTIPSSVKTIGNYAFQYCTSLTSVNIPSSVTSIGFRTFYNCSSLASVNIPSSVTSIGGDAFSYCNSLRAVAFSSKDITIGDDAFIGCQKLKHVHIPEGSVYTDFYSSDNRLPSDPSCYYTAYGESTCSLGKRCPFVYDELLNQYIIKVIDQETGDVYVNAIVQSEDENYSAVTDENGKAHFDIADDDDNFWDKDITFEVYFDEKTKLGADYASPSAITDDSNGTSGGTVKSSASLNAKRNSAQTILVNNQVIQSITFAGENVKMNRRDVVPTDKDLLGEIHINENGSDGYSLNLTFLDEVPKNDMVLKIELTNSLESRNNNGQQEYIDFEIYEKNITETKLSVEKFSNLIYQKLTTYSQPSRVSIRPNSRIKITVAPKGAEENDESNYCVYLSYAPKLVGTGESDFGVFDASKITAGFGKFSGGLSFDKIPGLNVSASLDLSNNKASIDAEFGIAGTKVNKAEKERELYKKESEAEKKQREEEKFLKDYPDAKNLLDKDGNPVRSLEQLASSPDAFELLKRKLNYGKVGAKDLASGLKSSMKPYFDVSAAYHGEGKISCDSDNPNDLLITVGGNLGVGATFGLKGRYNIPQFANLAYISGTLGGEINGSVEVGNLVFRKTLYNKFFKYDRIEFDPNVLLDFGVDAQVAAGVGVGNIVDANLAANLEGKASYEFLSEQFRNVNVGGDITLSAKILAWKNSYKLAGVSATLIDDKGNPDDYIEYEFLGVKHNNREEGTFVDSDANGLNFSRDLAGSDTISAADFTLIPRRSGEEQYVDPELNYETDDSSLSSKQIIATNVYEVSDPVIVNAGGTDYLFRFVDNKERSAVNGSTLVYSKKVNGVWSEPVMISDDGTADFDASVCTDGTDIYVSWSNISEELSDTALYTDAIEKTTISVAKLDTKTDTVSIIGTANVTGKSALSPSITVKNGTGIVAWTSNTSFDPLLNSGNDEIYYSTISGGKLSSPTLYASTGAGKTAGVVRTGYMGSELCIVYGCMESGGETETSELYGSVYTSAPVQLTSDSVPDTNPQFEKIGGQDKLFWYKNGSIVYSDTLGGEAAIALSGIIGDKYAIASSGDVTKIAWRDETEDGNVLKMVSYENGSFTNNYIGNELGVDPSQFTATIDSNNMLRIAYTYFDGGSCNLALTSEVEDEKVTVSGAMLDSSYKAGDTNTTLSVSVHNSGNRDIENASINIADGAGNVIGTYPISDFDLDIGMSKEYDIDITLPKITDYTTFTVSVADIECEPATFAVGYTEMYLTGDVYEAGGMRFADITVHNDSTVATSGSLAVIIDGVEVARSQLSSFDCTANSLNEFNLSELMDGNNFSEVQFVLEGTKQSNYAGSTTLVYTFDNGSSELASDVAENIKVTLSDNSARLTWDAIDGADTYYIYRFLDGEFTLCGSTYKLTYTVTDVENIDKYGFIVVPSDKYDLSRFIDKVVFPSKRSLQECIDYINDLLSGKYKDSNFFELTDEELEMIETILSKDYEKKE